MEPLVLGVVAVEEQERVDEQWQVVDEGYVEGAVPSSTSGSTPKKSEK